MTVGLGCVDRFDEIVRAGADEVFCGYVPEKWTDAFGALRPLNRRESLWTNAQAGPITEMRILREKADRAGIPVAVALNALCDKGWIVLKTMGDDTRRKEYVLTEKGKDVLAREVERLKELVQNGEAVLREEM